MGWIIVTLSIALVCGAGVLVATARRGGPARHARRGTRATARDAAAVRSARARSVGVHPAGPRTRRSDENRGQGGDLASMARHLHRLRRPADERTGDDDPFEVLALQCRLTALAAEIQRLEHDRSTIALAHHLRATQYAYDALLGEACRLIGVQGEAEAPRIPAETTGSWTVDEETRMRKELELCSRGWTW